MTIAATTSVTEPLYGLDFIRQQRRKEATFSLIFITLRLYYRCQPLAKCSHFVRSVLCMKGWRIN